MNGIKFKYSYFLYKKECFQKLLSTIKLPVPFTALFDMDCEDSM